MTFIFGMCVMWAIYRICLRLRRAHDITQLHIIELSHREMQKILQNMKEAQRRMEEGRKLDQQLVIQAMRREAQARAALEAILKRFNVDLIEIAAIMAEIDGDKHDE